jgi:copper(I)-binding protein
MRTVLFAAFAAAVALTGCNAPNSDNNAVRVEEAIVTLPAVAGRPGAAYFTMTAPGAGVRLQRVESASAGRAELHEAGMRPVAEVPLPAGEAVRFAPGGRHVMLFELDPALRPGARIALTFTFTFAGAEPVTAEADVRAPGDVHSRH